MCVCVSEFLWLKRRWKRCHPQEEREEGQKSWNGVEGGQENRGSETGAGYYTIVIANFQETGCLNRSESYRNQQKDFLIKVFT